MEITVNELTYPEAKEVTKDDVWGKWTADYQTKIHGGMVVARADETCPIWGDRMPYKTATIVCDEAISEQVAYWCEHVHGADSITKVKELEGGKIALRSEYNCW